MSFFSPRRYGVRSLKSQRMEQRRGWSIAWALAAIVATCGLAAACGSSKSNRPGDVQGEAGAGAGGASSCTDGSSGSCAPSTPRVCLPGEPLCNGNVATLCADDGSGPKRGGTSCGDQLCVAGKCLAVECDASATLCSGNELYRCNADGKSLTLVADCGTSQACDADQGKCVPRVCTPNEKSCDGNVVKTCNPSGSGFQGAPLDCAADGLKCLAGACSDKICEPVLRYCRDDNIVQCSLKGDEFVLQRECVHESEHCEEFSGGFAECYADVCTPGQVGCHQNAVKVCNDEGIYPADGESCGKGYCQDGECVERPCEPDTLICEGSDIYLCQYQAPPVLFQECEAPSVCRSAGPFAQADFIYGAFCGSTSCSPGETACLQNRIGTCGEDGESLTLAVTDCASSDQICTAEPKCAASAVDQLGVDELLFQVSDGYFAGNVVEVTSTRTLTQLRTWLAFLSARQLRWVVYEQVASSFVAKVDKVSSVTTSSGVVASPAFDFQLQAGKRYLLGVAISGGDVSGYADQVPLPRASFGVVYGMLGSPYTATIDFPGSFETSLAFLLEVTTTP